MRRPRVERSKLLGELQNLIGEAQSVYNNDRAPDRADKLLPILDRCFEIVLILRKNYAPR